MECNNCGEKFGEFQPGALVIRQGGNAVACVCPGCNSGVKKAKIVLTRNAVGDYEYDQFNALEMEKKAFGKSA